jgi:hypothetical protein
VGLKVVLLREPMKFNRSLSLILLGVTAVSFAQQDSSPEAVYRDLKNSTYWTHPSFAGKVDLGQLKTIADEVKPYEFRLLAIPQLGGKWVKNGTEQRLSFAKYLGDQKLPFGDKGIILVLTRKGLSAYNKKLSATELKNLNNTAAKLAKPDDFTPAIRNLAKGVFDLAQTKAIRSTPNAGTSQGRSPSFTPQSAQPASNPLGGLLCLAVPLALIAGVVAIIFGAKKQKINLAKRGAEETKVKALNAMTYLDSYDGLLKMGQDADAVRQYRDRMGQTYDEGMTRLRNAKTVADYDIANNTFNQVVQDMENAKPHVSALTGDGGVAFTIPPIIDNQRAPLFEPMQGVSYFSSEPSDQLIPVEVNFGGTRKTVMVTPGERDQLMRGQMPQLRGQYGQDGQFMPWYAVQGYNPHRDFGSRNFLWDMVAISALSNMFMPHYGYGWGGGLFGGGYGGHGYGGGDTIINNYYDQNPGEAPYTGNSGDFDFGNSGGSDSSGDFDFGSGGNDSGGFDFGGGGGDFGGGGDSGGGGDF